MEINFPSNHDAEQCTFKSTGIHFFLSVDDDTFHVISVVSYIAKKVLVATQVVKRSREFSWVALLGKNWLSEAVHITGHCTS